MVIKPYVVRPERDRRLAAGRSAEERMAHYLDRHFGESKTIHVLHDLRIEYDGDHAQLDHLVLYPYGAAIVESKSVTTAVRINASGEWARWWNGRWMGMPDPLLQGQRQGLLLKRLLASRADGLLDTIVFGLIQGTFTFMAIEVFTAISDGGVVERERPEQCANAFKADAVPTAIVETIARHRKATSLLNFNPKSIKEAPRDFKEGEVLRVAHFLREHHAEGSPAARERVGREKPVPTPTPPTKAPTKAPTALTTRGAGIVLACMGCGSHDLEALIGRYGPYGRCRLCSKNTSVGRECPHCRARMRFERADAGFAGTCGECHQTTTVRLGAR